MRTRPVRGNTYEVIRLSGSAVGRPAIGCIAEATQRPEVLGLPVDARMIRLRAPMSTNYIYILVAVQVKPEALLHVMKKPTPGGFLRAPVHFP